MSNNINDEDLIYNTATRIPICFCVDTSIDIGEEERFNTAKELLERGIKDFYRQINDSDTTRDCTEIGIVTFNNQTKIVQNYSSTTRFDESKFKLSTNQSVTGSGDLGAGILSAIDLLIARKQEYNAHGVDYFQPWLVVITDGKEIRKECKKNLSLARKAVLKKEKKKGLIVLTIYVNNEHDKQQSNLDSITKKSKKRSSKMSNKNQPQIISTEKVPQFFDWLSNSIKTLSFGNDITLDFSGLTDWEDI